MNYTKLQNCVVEIWLSVCVSSPLYTCTIYIEYYPLRIM